MGLCSCAYTGAVEVGLLFWIMRVLPKSVMCTLVKGRQRGSTHTGGGVWEWDRDKCVHEPKNRQRMLEKQIFRVFGRLVPC